MAPQSVDGVESEELAVARYEEVERRLEQACIQIELLDDKLQGLKSRHRLACSRGHCPAAFSLHLQIQTVTGVREMYHKYAAWKAEQLHQLSVVQVQ